MRPSSSRRWIVRSERTTVRFYDQPVRYRGAVATTRSIELRTTVPGPRWQELMERHEQALAAPLVPAFPIVAERASGATLVDVDGNTFIDFTGGVGCMNVGHSHPKVLAAVHE